MTDIADYDHTYGPEFISEDGELTERGEWTISHALGLLAQAAHRNARSKGWYDEGRGFPEELALVHSEVSEVLEAHRDGSGSNEHRYSVSDKDNPGLVWRDFKPHPKTYAEWGLHGVIAKPEGIPSESADILIRVADYAGNPDRPVDIGRAVVEKLRYNRTRPRKHGRAL